MPQLKIDNLKIYYEKSGIGEPLLILHGWGIDSTYFKDLAKFLSSNFTVLNLDLPGFGQSDLPPDAWSVSDYVEFIEKFSKKINLKDFYLFGHSFGGRITIKFSIKNPEKLKGIILCAGAGIKHRQSIKKNVFLILAKTGKTILALPGLKLVAPYAKKLLYKAAREHDYEKLNNKIIQETFKKVVQEDLRPYLHKITAPALLMWGAEDKLTPLKDGKIMNREIKNSKLEVFENVGHKLPYALPKEVSNKICQFFK